MASLPPKLTPHPTEDRPGTGRARTSRPTPLHVGVHPISLAHTQPAGWPWLAALRQDMTVCLAWRTSGHLAFAVRGSCVILALSRGDSGGC